MMLRARLVVSEDLGLCEHLVARFAIEAETLNVWGTWIGVGLEE